MKQDYARKFSYSIDNIELSAEIGTPNASKGEKALSGYWIYGPILEGGYWLDNEQLLDEARPETRQQPLPPIQLVPRLLDNSVRL